MATAVMMSPKMEGKFAAVSLKNASCTLPASAALIRYGILPKACVIAGTPFLAAVIGTCRG